MKFFQCWLKWIKTKLINVHLKSKYCIKIKILPLTENGTGSLLIPQYRNPVLDQRMCRHIHLQKPNKHCYHNQLLQEAADKRNKNHKRITNFNLFSTSNKKITLISFPSLFFHSNMQSQNHKRKAINRLISNQAMTDKSSTKQIKSLLSLNFFLINKTDLYNPKSQKPKS